MPAIGYGWQQAVLQEAGDLSLKTLAWREQIQAVVQRCNSRGEFVERVRLKALSQLLAAMQRTVNKDLAFAFLPNANEIIDAVSRAAQLLQQFAAAQTSLSCSYDRKSLLQCLPI